MLGTGGSWRTAGLTVELQRDIKDVVGITARVVVCAAGTLERSVGKAKRVVDKRNLAWADGPRGGRPSARPRPPKRARWRPQLSGRGAWGSDDALADQIGTLRRGKHCRVELRASSSYARVPIQSGGSSAGGSSGSCRWILRYSWIRSVRTTNAVSASECRGGRARASNRAKSRRSAGSGASRSARSQPCGGERAIARRHRRPLLQQQRMLRRPGAAQPARAARAVLQPGCAKTSGAQLPEAEPPQLLADLLADGAWPAGSSSSVHCPSQGCGVSP